MKTKPLIIIIITLLVIAGITVLLIKPVVSSILSSWRDLSKAKANLEIIEEKTQVLEALKNDQNLSRVADIAQKYIPKEEESGQLIIELTAMAQANSLKIEQTSLEKSSESSDEQTTSESGASPSPTPNATSSPTPEAKTVEFSMNINGTFPDFMNFLKAIETSSRLIVLNNLSMQTKESSDQSTPVTFSAQFVGVAYYKQEDSLSDDLDNIKIAEETMEQFLNLKTYGQPINLPGESGFGRTNPFENY